MIRFLQSPGKVKKYLLGGLLVFISITMLLYLIPQGGSNISVTPADIEREYQRQNLKVKLQYAVVSLADLSKQITVSEPEITAYYQSHKSQYENSVPEKRKAKYAVIDVGKLAAGEQISPSELLGYYNQHKSEFQQQEEIKASHILIKTEAGPDGKVSTAADAAARKKAEDILKKLRAGDNFEELAKKESDDKASAINGDR